MHDNVARYYTTQCYPILTQQDIVMGIPEFKVARTSFKIGIPEVTMKRQDWYFDLPKLHLTEGCVGADCERKCTAASNKYTNDYQGILQPAIQQARTTVASANSTSMQCQRGVLQAQRDATLAQIDASIATVKGSLATLQSMGATAQAGDMTTQLNQLLSMRSNVAKQFDDQLSIIAENAKKAAEDTINPAD